MANSSYTRRCIQLVAQDAEPGSGKGDGPIDCYVYLEAYGDSPIGVHGWHHRRFDAYTNAVDILTKHLPNDLLWDHKAPPEFQEWRVWMRLKDAHPDLPRAETPAFNRDEAMEAANRLRLSGNTAGVEVLTHEHGWVAAFVDEYDETVALKNPVSDEMAEEARRLIAGGFERSGLVVKSLMSARPNESAAEWMARQGDELQQAFEDMRDAESPELKARVERLEAFLEADTVAFPPEVVVSGGGTVYTGEAFGIYAYGAIGADVTADGRLYEISGGEVVAPLGLTITTPEANLTIEEVGAAGVVDLGEVGIDAAGQQDAVAETAITLEGVSSTAEAVVTDARDMSEDELANWRGTMAAAMETAHRLHRDSYRLLQADLVHAGQFMLDHDRPGAAAAICTVMQTLFPGDPLPPFMLAGLAIELPHPGAGTLDPEKVAAAREIALNTPLQLHHDLCYAAGWMARAGLNTGVAAIGVALERLTDNFELPLFMRGLSDTIETKHQTWNSTQAVEEGWTISGETKADVDIMALAGVFDHDHAQAKAHVEQRAGEGSVYHQMALKVVAAVRAQAAN